MQGGGFNGQKRQRGQLFIPAKTEGHSSIWDSIHPIMAKIFKASILGDLDLEAVPQKSEILTSPTSWLIVCFQVVPNDLFSLEISATINKCSGHKPP